VDGAAHRGAQSEKPLFNFLPGFSRIDRRAAWAFVLMLSSALFARANLSGKIIDIRS